MLQKLVDLFFEMGVLRRMKRSYHLMLLEEAESVAEHSHRAMIVAYFLGRLAKADAAKAALMAGFHDMAETRTGDSDWVQKQYLQQNEEKARKAQFEGLGELADELNDIIKEYKKRETLEAKLAKDADYIEFFMSIKELAWKGNTEAKYRLNSENTAIEHLYTTEGKKLARLVKKADPTAWTRQDLVETHKKYRGMTKRNLA